LFVIESDYLRVVDRYSFREPGSAFTQVVYLVGSILQGGRYAIARTTKNSQKSSVADKIVIPCFDWLS
jgi:hypothetical protein